MTNNIDDFKGKGIMTMEVDASITNSQSIPKVIQKVENVNNIMSDNPNYFVNDANIPLKTY